MIRSGRSVRTTVALSLLARLNIYVGGMAIPMCHVEDRKCQCHLRKIRTSSLWAYDSVDDVLEPQYMFDLARDRVGGLATLLLGSSVVKTTTLSGVAARESWIGGRVDKCGAWAWHTREALR